MAIIQTELYKEQSPTFTFTDPLPSLRLAAAQELSPLCSDNMYTLLATPEGNATATLDSLIHNMNMPILAFTGTLYSEIRFISESLPNSEFALFPVLTRIDQNRPHFLAYDFFMPGQSASSAGVSLDGSDCTKYFQRLKEGLPFTEEPLHRNLCHLHSHASMGTFWSSIDNNQQLTREDMGFMDDYRFYVVVNAKGDIKCSLVIYSPVLVRIDASVALSFGGPGHNLPLTRTRKQELSALIQEKVRSDFRRSAVTEFADAATETQWVPFVQPAKKYARGMGYGSIHEHSPDYATELPPKLKKDDMEDVFSFAASTAGIPPVLLSIARKNAATFAQAATLDPESNLTINLLAWMLNKLDPNWDVKMFDDNVYELFGDIIIEVYHIVTGATANPEECLFINPESFYALGKSDEVATVLGIFLQNEFDSLFVE